jgi:hypothetical protein
MYSDNVVGNRGESASSVLSVSSMTECDWLNTELTESDWFVESGDDPLFDLLLWLSMDTSTAVLLASLLTSKIVFVRSSIVYRPCLTAITKKNKLKSHAQLMYLQ